MKQESQFQKENKNELKEEDSLKTDSELNESKKQLGGTQKRRRSSIAKIDKFQLSPPHKISEKLALLCSPVQQRRKLLANRNINSNLFNLDILELSLKKQNIPLVVVDERLKNKIFTGLQNKIQNHKINEEMLREEPQRRLKSVQKFRYDLLNKGLSPSKLINESFDRKPISEVIMANISSNQSSDFRINKSQSQTRMRLHQNQQDYIQKLKQLEIQSTALSFVESVNQTRQEVLKHLPTSKDIVNNRNLARNFKIRRPMTGVISPINKNCFSNSNSEIFKLSNSQAQTQVQTPQNNSDFNHQFSFSNQNSNKYLNNTAFINENCEQSDTNLQEQIKLLKEQRQQNKRVKRNKNRLSQSKCESEFQKSADLKNKLLQQQQAKIFMKMFQIRN